MKERKPQPAAIEVDEECTSPTSLGLGRLRPCYAWCGRHGHDHESSTQNRAELRGSEARPAAYFGSISPLVHTGTRTRGTPALPAAGTISHAASQASQTAGLGRCHVIGWRRMLCLLCLASHTARADDTNYDTPYRLTYAIPIYAL